jgi:hypothetical protein
MTGLPDASAAPAPPQPNIEPPEPDTSPGILTKVKTPEVKAALESLPDVKEFSTSKPVYVGFADAAKQATASPHPVSDLALAEAYTKLFDPTARITEFKYDELKKSIPWLEKFKDAPFIIAREHTFPPEVRKEIVRSGLNVIDQREKALVPRFAYAERQSPGVLDSEQRQILNGVPFSKRSGFGDLSASPASGLTQLPSGRRVRFVPGP